MDKIIKSLDIFPYNFGFTFNKERNYKTTLGGFITLIYLVLFIFFAMVFSENLRKKMEPKLIFKDEIISENILKNLSKENFILGLFMENENVESILNNKYFNITVKYYDQENKEFHLKLISCKEIKTEKLNIKEFFKPHPEYLENGVCIDFSKENLQTEIIPFKTKIKLFISCLKEKKGSCIDNKQLKNIFLESKIKVFFLDSIFESTNFEEPLKAVLSEKTIYINVELEKIIDVAYKGYVVESDSGFFLSSVSNSTNYMIDNVNINYKLNNFDQDYKGTPGMIFLDLSFTSKLINIRRIYSKIQDVLAMIGGIMNTINIMAKSIVGIFSVKYFNDEMINIIFKHNNHLVEINDDHKYLKNSNKINDDTQIKKINNHKYDMNRNQKIVNDRSEFKNKIDIRIYKNENLNKKEDSGSKSNFKDEILEKKDNFRVNEDGFINNKSQFSQNVEMSDVYLGAIEKSQNSQRKLNEDLKKQDDILDKINFLENKNDESKININNKQNRKSKKDKLVHFVEKLHNKKGFIEFSLSDQIKMSLCPKKFVGTSLEYKKKFFDIYLDQLISFMEINNVVDIQSNFRIFKYVILNENQNNALKYFEYFFKNTINTSKHDLNKNEVDQLLKINEYFQENFISQDQPNEIDKKIFFNLKKDLLNIMKE